MSWEHCRSHPTSCILNDTVLPSQEAELRARQAQEHFLEPGRKGEKRREKEEKDRWCEFIDLASSFLSLPNVLVSSGCCNKMHRWCDLNNKYSFLQFWVLGNLRSRCG